MLSITSPQTLIHTLLYHTATAMHAHTRKEDGNRSSPADYTPEASIYHHCHLPLLFNFINRHFLTSNYLHNAKLLADAQR